ncbi:transglutaminase family protein [Roseisalinus antarcticus]|uniref:Transglutaminase-like superfamily protein n=1 Tax=Roseisalinus antarcticus TaxID=254357 RepID=A0A1Y5SF35_9RHOB|nr:transglutaminase family protein [Roseisalinus antarcticus]SLN37672.1 Transglutaminase-like superfamily protein [Roseisalinus antarcticus]
MRLQISHITRYAFQDPVQYGLEQLRLTPKSNRAQTVLQWQTSVEGGRKELHYEDYHNNRVDLISFDRNTTELTITSQGQVELEETHGVVGPHKGPGPLWLYEKVTPRTKVGPRTRALIRQVDGETELERLHALCEVIHNAVAYEVGASDSSWTAEDSAAAGKGVCQDHAHIFIAGAREMGFPARYVSGFLLMDDRIEQDATHAWAEAHVQGLGWVGFDVSNKQSPDIRYVRVATGLDYQEAAPVTGTRVGGNGESLSVDIVVQQQ